ncbi:outer membrane protein [Xanthobacter sp. V4C-4]|uniref:outer membrane protein n=1 Tax=Xanthobacter cornucopiae TaxID=3119924 RepID=UPI00372C44E5
MKPSAIAAALVAASLAAPALAADLSTREALRASLPRATSWTGLYVGGNVGYGGDTVTSDALLFSATSLTTLTAFDGTRSTSLTASGFVAGGQIGYNIELPSRFVLGLETDLQWSGIKGQARQSGLSMAGALSDAASTGGALDYFGTVRARLGYAMDRFLPYLTAGAAYGRVQFNRSVYDAAGLRDSSTAATNWGWTAGIGAEYAFADHWTMKAEYLYVDLGSFDYGYFDSALGITALGTLEAKFHTVKAGVNYRF